MCIRDRIYTTWVANWLNPDRANVRLMLILLMLAGLALSSAIPYAFGKNGWLFAAAYCSMQLGRSLYVVWASWGIHDGRARNFAPVSYTHLDVYKRQSQGNRQGRPDRRPEQLDGVWRLSHADPLRSGQLPLA